MPRNYWNCFAVVLRVINRKADICQTGYSIHFKLRIFPYSKFIHGSTTFKNNDQLFNLMFLLCVLFFTCTKLVVWICMWSHATNGDWFIWRRIFNIEIKFTMCKVVMAFGIQRRICNTVKKNMYYYLVWLISENQINTGIRMRN